MASRNKFRRFFLFILIVLFVILSVILVAYFSNLGRLKSAHFYRINIDGSQLYYADENVLYSYKLDGSMPQKIAEFAGTIFQLKTIPSTNEVLISTVEKNAEGDYAPEKWAYWLWNTDTQSLQQISDSDIQSALAKSNFETTNERISLKESDNGADIISEKFDGSASQKLGHLGKLVYPNLIPSYTGEYLLVGPSRGGGGYGHPASVISRDSKKVYKIPFYWYVSSGVWINGNQLLTSDQDGKKLITINANGTFDVEDASYLEEDFTQKGVSPSHKYLIMQNKSAKTLNLLNLEDKTTKTIDKVSIKDLKNDLPSDSTLGSVDIAVLGWDQTSENIFYGIFIENQNLRSHDRTYSKVVKVYNVPTDKSYTVAELSPENKLWLDMRLFAIQ